jgi:hypothetical protein
MHRDIADLTMRGEGFDSGSNFGDGRNSTMGRDIGALRRDAENVRGRVCVLERGYEEVLGELAGLKRGATQMGGWSVKKRGEIDDGE